MDARKSNSFVQRMSPNRLSMKKVDLRRESQRIIYGMDSASPKAIGHNSRPPLNDAAILNIMINPPGG